MTDAKGKRRGTCRVSSRLFRKLGLPVWQHADVSGSRMTALQKGLVHSYYHGKTRRGCGVLTTQHWCKQTRYRRGYCQDVNIHIEHIKCPESQASVMRCLRDSDQEKEETRVQLKHQAPLSREAWFVRTNGEEPELLEPAPHECLA